MKASVVSLFSGAGGLDLAFERDRRFSVAASIELEPTFCSTLLTNQRNKLLGGSHVIQASVSDVDPRATVKQLVREAKLFGVIGGPPCESFSVMGRHSGLDDDRGKLVLTFASWVKRSCPDFFVMENVPHLLQIHEGKAFERLLDALSIRGFSVAHAVLRASDYGAATVRRRLFIVGVRGRSSFEFPAITHADPQSPANSSKVPWRTVRCALAGLSTPHFDKPGRPQWHVRIKHTNEVQSRFERLLQGQADPIRKRTRLHWDRPSPSLMAGNLAGARLHIHPDEPRELTNREAARLHGFPDSFLFEGSRVHVAKQIANSVPVELGAAVAAAIAKHFDY
jgi:DNA (cytosine-5)-methyltransferase 1